jgi:transposase
VATVQNIGQQLFQNPVIIVDKFHYARHNFWALERVRKRVQKSFQDKDRIDEKVTFSLT